MTTRRLRLMFGLVGLALISAAVLEQLTFSWLRWPVFIALVLMGLTLIQLSSASTNRS